MSPRHAKRTSSVSAATRYRAATASRRACKRISAKSATRARALWRTSTRFPATIRSESQECGGGDLLRRSALAPAALLGNHFRCELLNSLRMHLSSASCDPSGRVGDDMVLLLHRPRELRWDIRAWPSIGDFRAGTCRKGRVGRTRHGASFRAHSPGHVEHSALSVTALAKADTGAKVASRALRAGHDDMSSGRGGEGQEIGTSPIVMLTSECCRQQCASPDANFLRPPARSFLPAATDFLFDRWQHYHVLIVT
jgi:hypothetical protein